VWIIGRTTDGPTDYDAVHDSGGYKVTLLTMGQGAEPVRVEIDPPST
jgi:hypothetical protein